MIDTHSHLLPGVDHGCPDMKTAVLMAREAAASGVTTVVCTPHLAEWDEDFIEHVGVVFEKTRAEVEAAGVVLQLKLGFEVDFGVAVGAETSRLQALAIEGSHGAILLETPYAGWPPYVSDMIFRLSTAGFVPVLAHPERNDRIQDSSALLAECLRAGAVAQATAGSLGGMFGRTARRTFFRLISEGLITLLASDAHSFQPENWTMAPALDALTTKLSPEEILVLTDTNPRRLLAGERPAAVRPENGWSVRRGRMWLKDGR